MKHQRPRITRRNFLSGTAAATALISNGSIVGNLRALQTSPEDEPSPYTLHFAQPASKWPDALPVGNGRLGAMVFGAPGLDRLQLNEESIWDGEPNRDRNNPRAAAAIPRIRELLFAGNIAEAQALAVTDVLSIPRRMPCYQTLGDLHLDFSPMGLAPDTTVDNYRLQLDLDTAIAKVTFRHNAVTYTREIFSSAPDQVIVIRLTADKPGALHLRVSLDRPGSFQTKRATKDKLIMLGQALPVNDNPGQPVKEHQTGVRFHAALLAVPESGKDPACWQRCRHNARDRRRRHDHAIHRLRHQLPLSRAHRQDQRYRRRRSHGRSRSDACCRRSQSRAGLAPIVCGPPPPTHRRSSTLLSPCRDQLRPGPQGRHSNGPAYGSDQGWR